MSQHVTPRGLRLALLTALALLSSGAPPSLAAVPDRENASFARCVGPYRETCVVDGDTFWYRGTKIRIADINTPETGQPACRAEAELGAAATRRMTQLLNAGPFSLQSPRSNGARDTDRYARALRIVTRQGDSLGARLVAEGLAETWQGKRGSWC